MKYKVGDKVKIKTWEDMYKEFGLNSAKAINIKNTQFPKLLDKKIKDMSEDRILKIRQKRTDGEYFSYYYIEGMENCWVLTDEMIEYSLEEKKKEEELRNRPTVNRFELMDFDD